MEMHFNKRRRNRGTSVIIHLLKFYWSASSATERLAAPTQHTIILITSASHADALLPTSLNQKTTTRKPSLKSHQPHQQLFLLQLMTLTFEPDLDGANYLDHKSCSSKVNVQIHTHTHQTDCTTWITKLVSNKN